MENNKLQELTEKLYEEGLSRGRTDAERMVAEAQQKAKKIIDDARAESDRIMAEAARRSEELKKNTATELSLAARQSVADLKESIAELITARSVAPSVHSAAMDPAFVKDMLLAIATNWHGENVELNAILPESMKARFDGEFAGAVQSLLSQGVEVGYSKTVKNGFKIAPSKGGYYISFTDADFDALLGRYLKEKTAKLLYDER